MHGAVLEKTEEADSDRCKFMREAPKFRQVPLAPWPACPTSRAGR
jgi:hypothetical protein